MNSILWQAAAALLHDTIEDTATTPEQFSGAFGKSVAAAQSIVAAVGVYLLYAAVRPPSAINVWPVT